MSADAKLLGQFVKARREELGLSQQEVADAGGPSDTTMSKLENGLTDTVSNRTLKRLDSALGWEAGSARAAYVTGSTPVVIQQAPAVEDPRPGPAAQDVLDEIARMRRDIADLQASIAAVRGDVEPDDQ